MKLLKSRIFWGLMLIVGGIVLLLEQMNILEGSEVFWMVVSAVAGLLFLIALVSNQGAWWAVIPGVSLLALGVSLGLTAFSSVSGEIIGAIVLGGIGFSFLIVYLIQRTHWWAIIPAGVLITLSIVAGLESRIFGLISGGIFFIGLGTTFALVAVLPNKIGRMTWAWIPSGILLVLGVLIFARIETVFNYIWPVVLIILGMFFLWRSLYARKK